MTATSLMPKFIAPVKSVKVADVESTSISDDDFDLSPEAWAAFDRLCDHYGIHQSRPRIKKSARWA